jgi:RNA polymerase sigma-70 factor (ECF subfamily)
VSDSTHWSLIERAAAGGREDREAFVVRYAPVVRGYLAYRWKGVPLAWEVEDAIQEVFLDCFREGGALDRVDPAQGGFRAFLRGVVRIIALRRERAAGRAAGLVEELVEPLTADDERPSREFDREWARMILREALRRLTSAAAEQGARAEKRVELLRLRVLDDVPIREVATRWNADAAFLHHEYARARREFRAALEATLAFHASALDSTEGGLEHLLELLR